MGRLPRGEKEGGEGEGGEEGFVQKRYSKGGWGKWSYFEQRLRGECGEEGVGSEGPMEMENIQKESLFFIVFKHNETQLGRGVWGGFF